MSTVVQGPVSDRDLDMVYLYLPDGIQPDDGGGRAEIRYGAVTVFLSTCPLAVRAVNNWELTWDEVNSDGDHSWSVHMDGEFTVSHVID